MKTTNPTKKENFNKKSLTLNENSKHNINFDSYFHKNLSRKEIKEKIEKIFLNLAKFSEVDNQYYISQLTVNKILKESSLVPENPILIGEIDILFKKINPNKNRLNCDQFLNFLVKLVQKMFPTDFKKDNVKTVNAFLGDFFDNYNSMIEKDNNINLSLPYKTIEAIITYIPDEKQKIILSKISQTLKEIYIKYFEFELGKNKTLAKKSLNNLIDFARDFEIYPYIINQTQLVTYYNIMTKNDSVGIVSKANCGELFTFDKFCLMIVHFSILSYLKQTEDEDKNGENEVLKLILFLEALENSKGMKNFIRKLNKPTGNKLSLIPEKKVIYEMFGIYEEEKNNEIININLSRTPNQEKPIDLSSINVSSLYQEVPSQSLSEINELITSNLQSITKTFLHFCRLGDKLQYNQMTLSSYMKYIKHCNLFKKIVKEKERISTKSRPSTNENNNNNNGKNLFGSVEKELNEATKKYLYSENSRNEQKEENNSIKTISKGKDSLNDNSYKKGFARIMNSIENTALSESEIEIIFTKITGGANLKMNIIKYLKSFQLIAEQIYPKDDIGTSLLKVLNKNIIPNLLPSTSNNEIDNEVGVFQFAFAKLKDQNIKYFLKKFSLSLVTYYKYYCNSKNNMVFENFYNFFKNFGIFPDMINLIQLRNLFFFLSHFDKKKLSLSSKDDYITFTNLTEAIAICAIISDFEEYYNDIDKIIYVIEKMSNSNGVSKCQQESGRTFIKGKSLDVFLEEVKHEYPGFYTNVNVSYRDNLRKAMLDKSLSFNDIYGNSTLD